LKIKKAQKRMAKKSHRVLFNNFYGKVPGKKGPISLRVDEISLDTLLGGLYCGFAAFEKTR